MNLLQHSEIDYNTIFKKNQVFFCVFITYI